MIAEDDPVSRLALEEALDSFGFEVITCSDGDEAWRVLSGDDAPELVVLDWMMPGMDGLEICKQVRESTNPASTYIMMLTVKGRREDMIEGLHAGADDYITKPFDIEEFRARVRVGQRLVDLQRQRIEQETAHYVEQLERMVAELQESRTRVVEAQEDVRKAIAEELHGHIQTQMCVLYFRLVDLQEDLPSTPEQIKAELAEIASELDDLRENEIRKISHRLHPSIIRLGLCAGLRFLRDQYERAIPIDLDISDKVLEMEPPEGSTIPASIRLGLYRVAEEAIGNVIKHSGATKMLIHLWVPEGDDSLRLVVEDNGSGFEVGVNQGTSLGLATIKDYVDAVGGFFELDSAPQKGTRVTAGISLEIQ